MKNLADLADMCPTMSLRWYLNRSCTSPWTRPRNCCWTCSSCPSGPPPSPTIGRTGASDCCSLSLPTPSIDFTTRGKKETYGNAHGKKDNCCGSGILSYGCIHLGLLKDVADKIRIPPVPVRYPFLPFLPLMEIKMKIKIKIMNINNFTLSAVPTVRDVIKQLKIFQYRFKKKFPSIVTEPVGRSEGPAVAPA